uniref:Uncharacterized protein MANES_02G138400 n=2 Tax=Rhizophora mucronata TaxID=61149 RepID=A0A2P2MF04_RHIMU
MVRVSLLPLFASPAASAVRLSLIPTLFLSSSSSSSFSFSSSCCPPSLIHRLSTFAPLSNFLPKTLILNSSSHFFRRVPSMVGHPWPKASFSSRSGTERGKELLVQHLLVKEDDLKLLTELEKRIWGGEDLSDLAAEYSICPSKGDGGMLGWIKKGQMVPEFEETAFSAPLNKVVRCKTEFGWHLMQVLSEREECLLQDIQPNELHEKMQDPKFVEEAQLIDVREPDEVATASLPGFQLLPLRQFGNWGPEITTELDLQKETYVMCHHGVRSLQVAMWLQTQGFRKVFNVAGGIHAYAVRVDPSVPTY